MCVALNASLLVFNVDIIILSCAGELFGITFHPFKAGIANAIYSLTKNSLFYEKWHSPS